MKKIAILGAVLAVAFAANVVRAATVDTKTVPVTASVAGVNTLTTSIKLISNNTPAAALTFGSVSNTGAEWSNAPLQYVQMSVDDNAVSWRLRNYTDNFAPIASSATHIATWGEQFGGMISQTVAGAKVPMGWLVNPTTIENGPGLGDPAFGRVVSTGGVVSGNGFTYLKDRQDFDIAVTTGSDESFLSADAGGYTDVARGGVNVTRIVRPNLEAGTELLATATAPFYYYVEGNFRGAQPTAYGTTIKLDLINQ